MSTACGVTRSLAGFSPNFSASCQSHIAVAMERTSAAPLARIDAGAVHKTSMSTITVSGVFVGR